MVILHKHQVIFMKEYMSFISLIYFIVATNHKPTNMHDAYWRTLLWVNRTNVPKWNEPIVKLETFRQWVLWGPKSAVGFDENLEILRPTDFVVLLFRDKVSDTTPHFFECHEENVISATWKFDSNCLVFCKFYSWFITIVLYSFCEKCHYKWNENFTCETNLKGFFGHFEICNLLFQLVN